MIDESRLVPGYTAVSTDTLLKARCQELMIQWLNSHCEGSWYSGGHYVAFELESDALLFQLGFE